MNPSWSSRSERSPCFPVDQFSEVAPPRIVLPGATKEALKQMPEFKYAKEEQQVSRQ